MAKKILILIAALLLVLVLSFLGIQSYRARVLNNVAVHKSDTPTIVLHGSGGNYLSLGPMTIRLAQHDLAQRAMTIRVDKAGNLDVHQYRALKNNPLILVLLKDNKNPIGGQKALSDIMKRLYKDYGVRRVNFIGHSMGGGIMFRYLEQPQANTPKVLKFVSLSVPYLGFGKYMGPNSPYFQDMVKNKNNLPKDLRILNMVGNVNGRNSDTQVTVHSALGLKTLTDGQIKQYQAKVIAGNFWTASHFMIHENPNVDKMIAEFLWGQ